MDYRWALRSLSCLGMNVTQKTVEKIIFEKLLSGPVSYGIFEEWIWFVVEEYVNRFGARKDLIRSFSRSLLDRSNSRVEQRRKLQWIVRIQLYSYIEKMIFSLQIWNTMCKIKPGSSPLLRRHSRIIFRWLQISTGSFRTMRRANLIILILSPHHHEGVRKYYNLVVLAFFPLD